MVDQVGQKNGIARLPEIRIGRSQIHCVREQSQHSLVASALPPLGNQTGPGLPECDTPDFSLMMDFVSRGEWQRRTLRHVRVRTGLLRVNVFKRQWIF